MAMGLARRSGRTRAALLGAAALLALGAAPQAHAQLERIPQALLEELALRSPDPETRAARRLLASQNLLEAALRAADLRLVRRRERALERADRDFERGDFARGDRQFERALRADERRNPGPRRRPIRRWR